MPATPPRSNDCLSRRRRCARAVAADDPLEALLKTANEQVTDPLVCGWLVAIQGGDRAGDGHRAVKPAMARRKANRRRKAAELAGKELTKLDE
jgi:hypothetical protein